MGRLELARRLGAGAVQEAATAPMVVEERDPARFATSFAAAAAQGGPVFLADPAWGAAERAQLAVLLAAGEMAPGSGGAPGAGPGWLMIPSGGTSGRLKFARHDEETIGAAVGGFCAHFGASRVSAVGLLPLCHVSGFMAWMRCALTGGDYLGWDWKRLEAGERPPRPDPGGFHCVSLVPTQLHRLLASEPAIAWLRTFDAVFLGGGPGWPALFAAAAAADLPLAPSYGMTETAAMAAALRPAEFRAGHRSSGVPLPHIRISIAGSGGVRLEGDSLFRGYYPDWRTGEEFLTDDLGSLDERGQLHILGRRDAVIITGGKKVDPAEVEAALRASGAFEDIAVVGVPDPEWGQSVVACYPAASPGPDLALAARHVAALAPHKRPRRYVAVEAWPRNAQGKLNRTALAGRAAAI